MVILHNERNGMMELQLIMEEKNKKKKKTGKKIKIDEKKNGG
jgi:hypothetical protein